MVVLLWNKFEAKTKDLLGPYSMPFWLGAAIFVIATSMVWKSSGRKKSWYNPLGRKRLWQAILWGLLFSIAGGAGAIL